MTTSSRPRNLLRLTFFSFSFILYFSGFGAAQLTTGRPASILENEASYGDFAPVGAGGLYTNPQTGERYNNAMAATLSILRSQTEQWMQSERQKIIRRGIIGGQVIKGGLATTALPLTNYKGKQPLEVQALESFEQELKTRGLKQTDAADCQALMVALSFEVFSNGEKANQQQILNQKQAFHKEMMKSTGYQGLTVSERVAENERYAVQTMVAYNIWQMAKTKPVPADALLGAWETAKGVLKWQILEPDNIFLKPEEFVIATTTNNYAPPVSSTATTAFKRNGRMMMAEDHVARFGGDIKTSGFTRWVQDFDKIVISYNSPTNDGAVANAAAFVVYYKIYSGVKLNANQYQWVLKEMEKDLKTNIGFQKMDDTKRQLYYEDLATEAMNLFEQAQKSDLKDDAYQKMKEVFAPRNLNDYRLTENGFVKK